MVRLLCLTLGPPTYRTRVAAFVCCNFLVICSLVIYFVFADSSNRLPHLDIGLKTSWYLRRDDWLARDPIEIEYLDLPLSYVIISHTATPHCNDHFICIADVMRLQLEHISMGYVDVTPNFLVSGNGLVFEGRGANIMGAMVPRWNARSIIIAFMGDYMVDEVVEEQLDHINVLLGELVKSGALRRNYNLYAHCQLQWHVASPGLNVIKHLQRFGHWNNDNIAGCLIK